VEKSQTSKGIRIGKGIGEKTTKQGGGPQGDQKRKGKREREDP